MQPVSIMVLMGEVAGNTLFSYTAMKALWSMAFWMALRTFTSLHTLFSLVLKIRCFSAIPGVVLRASLASPYTTLSFSTSRELSTWSSPLRREDRALSLSGIILMVMFLILGSNSVPTM